MHLFGHKWLEKTSLEIFCKIQLACQSSQERNAAADELNTLVRKQSAEFISSEKWHGPAGNKSSHFLFRNRTEPETYYCRLPSSNPDWDDSSDSNHPNPG
jgi:hypothetical protein